MHTKLYQIVDLSSNPAYGPKKIWIRPAVLKYCEGGLMSFLKVLYPQWILFHTYS